MTARTSSGAADGVSGIAYMRFYQTDSRHSIKTAHKLTAREKFLQHSRTYAPCGTSDKNEFGCYRVSRIGTLGRRGKSLVKSALTGSV